MPSPVEKFNRLEGETEALPDLAKALEKGTPKKAPKQGAHKTGHFIPDAGLRHLTKVQKTTLGIISSKAFNLQRKYGNVPEGMTSREWRHEQRHDAIGTSDIKETCQCHWKRLRGHFKALTGDNSPEVFADLNSNDESDARAAIVRDIRTILAGMAKTERQGQKMRMHAAEAYALKIAQDRATGLSPKNIGQVYQTFNVAKLDGLRYTLRNRLNAWRGVGDSDNRNKSQRKN